MAKVGFTLDIEGLRKQLERVKVQIEVGATEGMYQGKDIMTDIMRVVMQRTVYDVYTPKTYERTYDLLNSIKAEVDDGVLYIYSDQEELTGDWGLTVHGRMTEHNNLPYGHRVKEGNEVYAYEAQRPGAAYMYSRDWVEVTKEEIIAMTNQSQKFLQVVRNAIQKRI